MYCNKKYNNKLFFFLNQSADSAAWAKFVLKSWWVSKACLTNVLVSNVANWQFYIYSKGFI